jgi:hypothetical protein
MANLRVIYNNLADAATILASSTASGFSVDNLKNTQKTSVHRSAGATVTYTLTWSTAQSISCVALPATNLQAGDTISVEVYTSTLETDTTALYQSPVLQACTGRVTTLYNKYTLPTYVDFGFGGATKTSVWLPTTYQVKKVVITLTSTSVAQIDCARIICGTYWQSTRQVNNGIQLGYEDLSEITTTRSGNTYEDRKPISETMQFDLEYLPDADRKQLQTLMRSWGSSALIYYCVFPDNTNPELTQSYSIYGRSNSNSLQYQFFSYYNTNLDIKSW